jgi:hypothetical protein
MCSADVAPCAEVPLAELLEEMRQVLALAHGVAPETVLIGPVDLGPGVGDERIRMGQAL